MSVLRLPPLRLPLSRPFRFLLLLLAKYSKLHMLLCEWPKKTHAEAEPGTDTDANGLSLSFRKLRPTRAYVLPQPSLPRLESFWPGRCYFKDLFRTQCPEDEGVGLADDATERDGQQSRSRP